MHIPDGYLSPQTCAVMYGAAAPFWVVGARRVRKVVKTRFVPLLALGAAYCFLVMMFNVPVPDGTTAHAVGGVLVAVLLGPWAAVIAVSVALAIQALFFGDGGVLAFGANCFNMAVVMPFAGYGVYRMLAGRASLTAPRRAVAAGVGAYVGINLAALCAAIEFGLQPELFYKTHGERCAGAVVRAVPSCADDPGDGRRAPPRRRGRRVRGDRGRDHVPPAGQRPDPADQPPRDRRAPTTSATPCRTQPGAAGHPARARRAGRAGAARSPRHRRRVRRGQPRRPRPEAVRPRRGPDAACSGTATSGRHALLPGYDFEHGGHPTVGYYVSAVVGTMLIAGVVLAGFRLATLRRRRAPRG